MKDKRKTKSTICELDILYIQWGSADIWKENVLKDLEAEELEYAIVEEFLAELKKEFGEENDETIKVAELKKVEQENRVMEEFE